MLQIWIHRREHTCLSLPNQEAVLRVSPGSWKWLTLLSLLLVKLGRIGATLAFSAFPRPEPRGHGWGILPPPPRPQQLHVCSVHWSFPSWVSPPAFSSLSDFIASFCNKESLSDSLVHSFKHFLSKPSLYLKWVGGVRYWWLSHVWLFVTPWL